MENRDECAASTRVFAVSFRAVPAELRNGKLFTSPALQLNVEEKSPDDHADLHFNSDLQNYFSFKSPDGSCRVIEASLFMRGDKIPWKIGMPLALPEEQNAEHEFALLFDGTYFSILCDGEIIDRDAPAEGRIENGGTDENRFNICCDALKEFRFADDLDGLTCREERVVCDSPAAFYTPRGFNTWVGDVVTYFFEGVFHIFYLHDRRHHQSRRGMGAHEFFHLTSTDLKNWVDHGSLLELSAPWQSFGTGNAFVYNGKLHLSFGWHTERAKPAEELADQLFHLNLEKSGHTGEFDYDQLGTLTPSGASYMSSKDGIKFTPSNKLIHYLPNPCIFPQKNGMLHLYHGGHWESDHPGSWRLLDPDFPPEGEKSFARNCLDCPNFFTLDSWDYFMVGFSGFFARESGTEKWMDFTEKGWDPYDGACVPMTAWFNGRLIEGSWPGGLGWGSCLMLREFVPLGNGRIGKKWVEETLPQFDTPQCADKELVLPGGKFSLLEADIDPADGIFSVVFTERDGKREVEFSIDPQNRRAQWSSTPGKRMMSFREKIMEHPEYNSIAQYSDIHFEAEDYAKEELTGMDEVFRLKIVICRDPKSGATIIDTEIGARHTMLTQRKDFHAKKISFKGGRRRSIAAAV